MLNRCRLPHHLWTRDPGGWGTTNVLDEDGAEWP